MIKPVKYFKALTEKGTPVRKEIYHVNPTTIPERKEAKEIKVDVYDYNAETAEHFEFDGVHKCERFKDNGKVTWINIDGLRKEDVDVICEAYQIHPLLKEDILSVGQRPKMDELDNVIFCLLNMIYFNEECKTVEQEQ
ncbi:unnamed protein product, partial [Adineta steineri]